MRELLEQTAQRAISYLEGLDARSVAPAPEAVAKLDTLNEPLKEDPTPPEQVVKLLDLTAPIAEEAADAGRIEPAPRRAIRCLSEQVGMLKPMG